MMFKYPASYHYYEKVLEFLITTADGSSKWRIIQNTKVINFNYEHAEKILSQLLDSENVVYNKSTKKYYIGDKGRHCLEVIKKFNKDYNSVIGFRKSVIT